MKVKEKVTKKTVLVGKGPLNIHSFFLDFEGDFESRIFFGNLKFSQLLADK